MPRTRSCGPDAGACLNARAISIAPAMPMRIVERARAGIAGRRRRARRYRTASQCPPTMMVFRSDTARRVILPSTLWLSMRPRGRAGQLPRTSSPAARSGRNRLAARALLQRFEIEARAAQNSRSAASRCSHDLQQQLFLRWVGSHDVVAFAVRRDGRVPAVRPRAPSRARSAPATAPRRAASSYLYVHLAQ